MSAGALADLAQLSEAELAQIEADENPPSIAVLLRIARGLDVGLSHFFQEQASEQRFEVVRAEDRAAAVDTNADAGPAHGYTYEALTHTPDWRHMQPLLIEFPRGNGDPVSKVAHDGEEFLFVLSGAVEFMADEERIELKAGDSLYFDSSMPHGFKGLSEEPARALAVVYAAREDKAE